MIIDLRSDTVTRPTKPMLEAMFTAKVGDDVLGEDPTINELEEYAAKLFGMEKALFCPSGTMTNQIAINVHTRPGNELICSRLAHIHQYEGGGIARNSGCSVNLIDCPQGIIQPSMILQAIRNPDDFHQPITTLVEVENTMNKGGGAYYQLADLKEIANICKNHNLKFHLDGARLFNALIETGETPKDYGSLFDSISICLSKGLGAPVGSLILGNSDFYKQAIRVRKVFGGAMRQAGYLAAAGLFALKNNTKRLKDDHSKAQNIKKLLESCSWVKHILPVVTNIIIFELAPNVDTDHFMQYLKNNNVLALSLSPGNIRFVTHLDVTDDMMEILLNVLRKY